MKESSVPSSSDQIPPPVSLGDRLQSLAQNPSLRMVAVGVMAAAVVGTACGGGGSERPATTESAVVTPAEAGLESDAQLVWEWDPSKPLETQWNIATPEEPIYNEEEQIYRPENVRMENGVMVLEVRRQAGEISSGRVSTEGIFSVGVGSRIEATMKLPRGQGTWPAFWMLSKTQPHTAVLNPSDADWEEERFYMHDGELDIMESYGSQPGMIEATVHTFDASTEGQTTVRDASDAFHTYSVDIEEDRLVWSIDGRPYFTFEKPSDKTEAWPFTQENEFFLILNLAMGGTGGGEIVDRPGDSWRLQVSSVKVYDLVD